MKRKILFAMMFLVLAITTVKAENLVVIEGNGRNPGDKLCVGSECFYVLKNDSKYIRMISEYNLYVGVDIYYKPFDKPFENYSEASNYVQNNIEFLGKYKDYPYQLRYINDQYVGVKILVPVDTEEVKQDKKARGIHSGDDGNLEFPFYGVYLNENGINDWEYPDYDREYDTGFVDTTPSRDSDITYYTNKYHGYLMDKGLSVRNVEIPAISDIRDFVYDVTKKELPLSYWYNNDWIQDDFDEYSYKLGNVKELLPEKYDWLFNTTYWTRTFNSNATEYHYYIDSFGFICASDECSATLSQAGLRPIVTVNVNEVYYNIKTKTDGNGKISVSTSESKSGETIKYVITPNEGYEIESISIITDAGEKIEVKDNNFIMPDNNVTIIANFKKNIKDLIENPETGVYDYTLTGIIIILSIMFIYIIMRRFNRFIKLR